MNEWECEEPACSSSAVGVGSAVGLRAIGWFFQRGTGKGHGPLLLCPLHRRDSLPIHVAEVSARHIQEDVVVAGFQDESVIYGRQDFSR